MARPVPARGSLHILRLERLTKRYGRRLVLAEVSLRIDDGEFCLLVGPNGAGKTTFLRLLSTYAQPSSGRVVWDSPEGESYGPEHIRQQLAVVGHQPLVYDELTAGENLRFALRVRGIESGPQTIHGGLTAFGLQERADDRVQGFSRGLRQRLALAIAFTPTPGLLLLDEPASGLDAGGVEMLLDALRRVKGRTTVIVATHEPDVFRPLATRTLEVREQTVKDWGRIA